jgi:hypothetical protein
MAGEHGGSSSSSPDEPGRDALCLSPDGEHGRSSFSADGGHGGPSLDLLSGGTGGYGVAAVATRYRVLSSPGFVVACGTPAVQA